jgi:hypothetical protein
LSLATARRRTTTNINVPQPTHPTGRSARDADDAAAILDQVREHACRLVGRDTFRTIAASLEPVSLEGHKLVLALAPNDDPEWGARRYRRPLEEATVRVLGADAELELLDHDDAEQRAAAPARDGRWLTIPRRRHIRAPKDELAHFPVELDPMAEHSHMSRNPIRRWEHVGADVEVDHISTPTHLRAMLAAAACLQDGDPEGAVWVQPRVFMRAAGVDPGGADWMGWCRVLADWNASEKLIATLHPTPWRKSALRVIDGPPIRHAAVITHDGERLEPAEALRRRLGSAQILALELEFDQRFINKVRERGGCRLLRVTTLSNLRGSQLPVYLRAQARSPENAGATLHKMFYSEGQFLRQMGRHGRVFEDPKAALLRDRRAVSDRNARRETKRHRDAELAILADFLRLVEIDPHYIEARMDPRPGANAVQFNVFLVKHGKRATSPSPQCSRRERQRRALEAHRLRTGCQRRDFPTMSPKRRAERIKKRELQVFGDRARDTGVVHAPREPLVTGDTRRARDG